jgi:ABC-2 type transport system permease protein
MFIIYGNGDDVMKKKQIIIEIIISSVKPFQLMIGKIIGTSLAGILQFFIWAFGLSLLFLHFFFELTGGNSEFSRINGTGAARICRYRPNVYQGIMEFTNSEYTNKFYSLFHRWLPLFAAIGAAVDNQTDSQQFLLPIIMPLVLSVYVGFFV